MPNCIFCDIIQRKMPAKILFEDSYSLAFEDINPKAPTHILIIPKRHIESVNAMTEEDELALGRLFLVARDLAQERKINRSGFRTVINTGHNAGQSVFHVHLHLLGGRPMAWPPG